MNRLIWFYAGGILLLLAVILAFVFWPAAPKSVRQAAGQLTHKQQRTATTARDQEVQAANQKRAAADRATANAGLGIATGNAAAAQATILRHQTHARRASSTSTTDTAVLRLQRAWTAWP